MNVFSNKRPNLSSSERTANVKAKNIYGHMLGVAQMCPGTGKNYTGTIRFDISGNVNNIRNYELSRNMAKGSALISDCNCVGMLEPGNPETWNANGTVLNIGNLPTGPNGGGGQTMSYFGGTGINWIPDQLNNSGSVGSQGSTLDGSGVWIDPNNNLFGKFGDCKKDKFLNYIELTGQSLDLKGNDTKKNYLYNYAPIGSGISSKAGVSRSLRPFYTSPSGEIKSCCLDEEYSWKLAKIGAKRWKDVKISGDGIIIVALETSRLIWRSIDSGITWLGLGLSNDWSKLTLSKDGSKFVAHTGTNGGVVGVIYYSLDGETILSTSIATGSPLEAITSSDSGDRVYLGRSYNSILGQDASCWYSITSGQSWIYMGGLSNQRDWYSSACSGDGKIVLLGQRTPNAVSTHGEIHISSNSGANWSPITSATGLPVTSNQKWYAIGASQSGKYIYAADYSTFVGGAYIWRSDDFGKGWVQTASSKQKWTTLACSGDGKNIIATAAPNIWLSDNYGYTWTQKTFTESPYGNWTGVDISTDGKIQVAADYGGIPTGQPSIPGRIWIYNNIKASYYQ